MGWDVGYMGDCPCGYHIHHFEEDRPGKSTVWLRCRKCKRADSESVPDEATSGFWAEPHPCAVCGSEQEPWDASWCPSCGRRGIGKFMYMPD